MIQYKSAAMKMAMFVLMISLTGCGSNLISTEPLNDGISETDFDTGSSRGDTVAGEGLDGGVGIDVGGISGTDNPVDGLSAGGVVANKPQNNLIYFEFNSAELSESSKALLQEHAAFLQTAPTVEVILEGHTDERGTVEYNLALGENRAQAVERYLSILGVSGAQLDVVSFGEERPRAFGSNESSWRSNRRVEIVY